MEALGIYLGILFREKATFFLGVFSFCTSSEVGKRIRGFTPHSSEQSNKLALLFSWE